MAIMGKNSHLLWWVYIVRCVDGSLYTGATTDVDRRVKQHNEGIGAKAAKYTRSRRPVTLVYKEPVGSKSWALRREMDIKALSKENKEKLINGKH